MLANMKLGTPNLFYDKRSIRLRSIVRAIAQYRFSSHELRKTIAGKIDEHTSLFLKGFGNEINLLSAFRELFFNSRELLDLLLTQLNRATAGMATQTPRNFLHFAKKVMRGEFDQNGLPIVEFLKTNVTYIFNIRKVRNEIKNNPATIEFVFNTEHFEARFKVPISRDEVDLVQYLDILNKEEAIKNMSYRCTYILDAIFPEMLDFWNTAFSVYDESFEHLTTRSS